MTNKERSEYDKEYGKLWRKNHPNYHKNYKNGVTLNLLQTPESKIIKEKNRLLKYRKIDKSTNCWIWQGKIHKNGAGVITVQIDKKTPKSMMVHRYSVQIFKNIILNNGEVIHHMCHNRKCFNPDHLAVTSQKINMLKKYEDWNLFYNEYKDLVDKYESIHNEVKDAYYNYHKKMQLKLF